MAVIIKGGTSGLNADVDANKHLSVNLPLDAYDSGCAILASSSDDGDLISGNTKTVRTVDSSEDYRLRVGMDTLMFEETFAGTAINTSMWDTPIATATVAQGGGFITLNAGGSLSAGQGSLLRSKRHFPIYSTFPISLEFLFNVSTLAFNNALCEIGMGLIGVAPGTPAVDGILMRVTTAGLSFVMTNNLNEVTETFVTFESLSNNGIDITKTTHGVIVISEDNAILWLDDIIAARINRSVGGANVTAAMQGQIFARQYTTGTNTLSTLKLNIAKISVNMYDMNHAKPWSHIMAGYGQFCQQGASNMTVGKTHISVANPHTTLAAQLTVPASTSLGTGGTAGLGGIQRLGNGANAVSLVADTAYITHSYQVPAAILTNPVAPAKNLYITGVKYSLVSRGAAGAANIGTFTVELNFGMTSVSPATAESATAATKTARTTILGTLSIPTSAEIGTRATGDVSQFFDVPIVVSPAEYVQLTLRPLVAYQIQVSQELLCIANFIGYWE